MAQKTAPQRAAADKYLRERVDTIAVRVPKGEKELVQKHARNLGESVNAFIKRAIRETMERDGAQQ